MPGDLPPIIHVVDDDASFRTAIGRLLRASGFRVMLFESAEQFLPALPGADAPSCILLDVQIPGLSGPALQERLASLGSDLPIIFVTGHGDIPTSVRAMKAGAEDFLTKPIPSEILLEAVRRAVERHRTTLERQDRLNALKSLLTRLTPRERQVFDLVVRGKMNKQIAFELGATERTIKAHRQKVMEKTGAQSLAELVSIAERLGMMVAPPSDT